MRALALVNAFFVLVVVAGSGCVEERYGAVVTTWDQSSSSSSSASSASSASSGAAGAASDKPKVTAKEAAAEIGSAGDCMTRAKEYYLKDHRAGQTLLAECVHKDGFTDLDGFLRGPWTKDLAPSEPFQVLVAEIIAHRGGFVEQDAKICRAAGVAIYDVTMALAQGKKAVGRLVIVRGSVSSTVAEKWGTGRSTIATIAESTWAEDASEEGGNIPVRDSVEDSGRIVFARIEKKEARFTADHALVVAMRLEGPRKYKVKGGDNDGDEETSILGVAVGMFDAWHKLRQ